MLCHYDINLQLFLSKLQQNIKIDFVKNYTIITKITRNLNCFMLYIELTNNKKTNFFFNSEKEGRYRFSLRDHLSSSHESSLCIQQVLWTCRHNIIRPLRQWFNNMPRNYTAVGRYNIINDGNRLYFYAYKSFKLLKK